MKNNFKYTSDNKKYHTLNYYYQQKFGCKVAKISLNAEFTCPNIDGTVGYGGCIYCSKLGSGDFAGNINEDLISQFNSIKHVIDKKWSNCKYIGYFQAHTNTYAPIKELKEKYELILKQDNVIGLSIATRCDAISEEVLEYLSELNKRTFLTIELGLQTIHEKTSNLINRCHSLKCFEDMIKELQKRNINVVVHIINGLPYETKEMMIETAKYLSKLKVNGIKIHMLHILKDTKLDYMYKEKPFKMLTLEEYVDIVCDQLENINPEIVIHRITGDPNEDDLVEPIWTIKKVSVLNSIDKELLKRNTYQGFNNSILNKFRQVLSSNIKPKDIVIDATTGNGKDTLFLANLVSLGHVYGFDIQEKAINNTDKLLKDNNIENYTLFLEDHSNINNKLNYLTNKVSAIIFNLGYLPGSNKNITTTAKNTVNAIKNGLLLLNNKGIILIVIYPHEEGKKEENQIHEFLLNNNLSYNEYHNTNNKKAPYLIVIYKITLKKKYK